MDERFRGAYLPVALLLSLVLDVALVVVLARVSGLRWTWALACVVGAQVYVALRKMAGAAVGLALFPLFRERASEHLVRWLAKNQFPTPSPDVRGGVEYLGEISDDDAVAAHLRVKAARELGSVDMAGGLIATLQLERTWTEAVMRYRAATTSEAVWPTTKR